jgi:alpha-beta hydrolase superfamily lysophospholipase
MMSNPRLPVPTSVGRAHCRVWNPPNTAKGTIVLVHGLGEHSGRYLHVGDFFSSAGFRVIAPDLVGHGRRTEPAGLIRTYSELGADVVKLLTEREPGPCFLFGHSLGGQLVLWLAAKQLVNCDGVIASAPWLRLSKPPGRWLLRAAGLLNVLLPSFRFPTGLQPDNASRDRGHLDSLADLELVHSFVRVRMYFEAEKAAAQLWANPRFNVPVLLACGGEDVVTSSEASREFFAMIEAPRKDFLFYPEMRHELHNEVDRARALEDYLAWIGARRDDKSQIADDHRPRKDGLDPSD